MNKAFIFSIIIFLVTIGFIECTAGQAGETGPQKIFIIRHGEKPDQGDNLSCQGFNRALQLPPVLHEKIGMPNTIFVPSLKLGKSTGVARMYQTIVPFAVKYNLEINTKYDVDDAEGIAGGIKKQTGTVLLVWEHKNISKILKALGITDAGKWDDNGFDTILIITYKDGNPVLARDKEGITPAADCK